jgi:hypothetical protein
MSNDLRLPHIGKYMRDRYTDDLEGEKRAMVEEQLKLASQQDLQKQADWFSSFNKNFAHPLARAVGLMPAKSTAPKAPFDPKWREKAMANTQAAKDRAKPSAAPSVKPGGLSQAVKQTGKSMVGGTAGTAAAGQPKKVKKPKAGLNP